MFDAASAAARAKPDFVQLRRRGLAADRKDVHVHRLLRPIAAGTRRRVVTVVAAVLMVLTVDLLFDLLELLVDVGSDLLGRGLLLLLNDDGFESLAGVCVTRVEDIAGKKAVVVETEHRLHDVLHLVAGDHRAHGKSDGNADQFPTKRRDELSARLGKFRKIFTYH